MSDGKSSLDALRIDRAAPARRGFGLLIGVIIVIALLGAGGAAAYVWWPAPGVPVQSVTAEANAAAASGAGLDATGYVVARRMATISPKIAGKLVETHLEEGERVKAGEIVARLDDSNARAALDVAMANEKQAEAMLADAEPTYHRYQQLRAQNAISEDAVQAQKTLYDTGRMSLAVTKAAVMMAQTNENDTVVRAPFDAIVTAKVAQAGDFVAPSAGGSGGALTGIATIVDMNSLEVEVDVSENYIERVHAGGQATIVLDAYPEWEIPADVIAVIPTADQTKGTVKVRVAIKAKDARILPQMGARVTFLTDAQAPSQSAAPRGVTVPLTAVQAGQGRSGNVFVIGEDDTIRTRPVTLGLKTAQTVTVLSGVAAGDRLAVGDFTKLHDGVKVAIQQ